MVKQSGKPVIPFTNVNTVYNSNQIRTGMMYYRLTLLSLDKLIGGDWRHILPIYCND